MHKEAIFYIFGQGVNLYGIMIAVGVVACLILFHFLGKFFGMPAKTVDFYELLIIVAVAVGFVSAAAFQFVYNWIESGTPPNIFGGENVAITFYGGLIGGAAVFILVTFLWPKQTHYKDFFMLLQIAAPVICIAHGFGRLGCAFGGCCGSTETVAEPLQWLLGTGTYQVQIYEALFLFALCAITIILCFYKKPFSIIVYLFGYGIFRFFMEILRNDHRGNFIPGLTPSQFWSILLMAAALFLLTIMILYKAKVKLPKFLHALGYNMWTYSVRPRDISTLPKKGADLVKASPAPAAPAKTEEAEAKKPEEIKPDAKPDGPAKK